jgi:hypothetical protein
MWPFTDRSPSGISQVNLIRYLIVWRVNGSFAQLPRCLSLDISRTLGTLIAERLPTPQARPWRKAMTAWDGGERNKAQDTAPVPEAAWPIEVVLWPYPGKRAYGQGEPILWELKLLGNDADHGLFLEVILPAMEEAATTSDERWHQPRTLWGRFDIQAVYVARGPRWEPVVSNGRLDLSYRPTLIQWAEGLSFAAEGKRHFRKLTWLTPFDLNASSLCDLLDALMARMTLFQAGKRPTPEQVWALLTPQEQQSLRLDCEKGSLRYQTLEPAPKGWPGRWIGAQTFAVIPPGAVPYLELASILHIGRQTHFGCGTFTLS